MSLLKQFIKYQSLGNDFIIFDWFKKPALFVKAELQSDQFTAFVKNICDRHVGVGADGVLIITAHPVLGMPEMMVYNADGSNGQMCLNGLRCVAHHLFLAYHFPEHFQIQLTDRVIDCNIAKVSGTTEIVTRVGSATVLGDQEIMVSAGKITGSVVTVGNPHFIVFDQPAIAWLQANGSSIETHPAFPNKTNVEFIWELASDQRPVGLDRAYGMLVHERGCGMTQACSSGASAVAGLLHVQHKLAVDEKIGIVMPGGSVTAWVECDGTIALQAGAIRVFAGELAD